MSETPAEETMRVYRRAETSVFPLDGLPSMLAQLPVVIANTIEHRTKRLEIAVDVSDDGLHERRRLVADRSG